MKTAAEFARHIQGARLVNGQWSGRCSAHDDRAGKKVGADDFIAMSVDRPAHLSGR